MFLKKLRVNHFKNHQFTDLSFHKGFNILYGHNGAGKSNILDAIHYLSAAKSFLNHLDSELIKESEDYFRIEGELTDYESQSHFLKIILQKGKRKSLDWDGAIVKKISEHIGRIPLVFICPQDQQILLGGSDERRRLFDITLSQTSSEYCQNIINYNHILEQRNKLLKDALEKGKTVEESLIMVYDEQLSSYAQIIHTKRNEIVCDWEVYFQDIYEEISSGSEKIQMIYKSDWHENKNLQDLLKLNRSKDKLLGYTTKGPHKDDLVFELRSHQAKKIGSQGQQKSLLIALKLAQFFYLKKQLSDIPILLIDDFHDKLDSERSRKLINLLDNANFEQIFITDTDKNRMVNALRDVNTSQYYYHTQNSMIKQDSNE